jgi:hypothetical protein
MCIAITCATSRSTFATSIYNTCNVPLKHLKHLKRTTATCAFSVASSSYSDEWRLVDAELDAAGVELAGGTKLGRGRGRWMERGHDGRREPGRGHAMRAGGARSPSGVGATSRSRGAQRAERAGGDRGGVADEAQNERATYTGSVRPDGV